MAVEGRDQNNTTYLILAVFVLFQMLKFYYLVPEAETGGDAAVKWRLAKDLANGSLEVFREPEFVNHHYLRWAGWLFPLLLVTSFGDSVVLYFASTAIPTSLAAIIFTTIIFRHFGPVFAALFALIWLVDPELNRATFQLLPTGAGLLPLALIVLIFQRFTEEKLSPTELVSGVAIGLFWLYGAKETNIFFAPGLFFSIWVLAGWRHAFTFAAAFTALYAIEAVILSAMLGKVMIGGRLIELLLGSGLHVNIMLEVSALSERWDAGIFSRWYSVRPVHIPIYTPAIIIFFAVSIRYLFRLPASPLKRLILCVSLMCLSFAIMTSFFFVSLDPIKLGQPIVSRYIAIILPLCAMAMFFVVSEAGKRLNFLNTMRSIALVLLIGALGMILKVTGYFGAVQWDVRTNPLLYDPHPLGYWVGYYDTLDEDIPDDICEREWREVKKVFYGLMYVPEGKGDAEKLKIVNECPMALWPFSPTLYSRQFQRGGPK